MFIVMLKGGGGGANNLALGRVWYKKDKKLENDSKVCLMDFVRVLFR